MSGFRICFLIRTPFPPFFKWVCINIPILIDRWPRIPDPDPGPLAEIDWLKGQDFNQTALADLGKLATIGQIALSVSDVVAKDMIHDALSEAVAKLDLPAEARVEFNGRVVREHKLENLEGEYKHCE